MGSGSLLGWSGGFWQRSQKGSVSFRGDLGSGLRFCGLGAGQAVWVFYFCFAIELRSSLFIVDVNPLSGPWYPLLSLGCFLSVDCFLCCQLAFYHFCFISLWPVSFWSWFSQRQPETKCRHVKSASSRGQWIILSNKASVTWTIFTSWFIW